MLKLGGPHSAWNLPAFQGLTKLHIQALIPSITQKAPGQIGRRCLLFFPVIQEMEEIDCTPHPQGGPDECPKLAHGAGQPTPFLSRGLCSPTCVGSQVCFEMRTLRVGFAAACVITSVSGCPFPRPRPSPPLGFGLLRHAGPGWHEL